MYFLKIFLYLLFFVKVSKCNFDKKLRELNAEATASRESRSCPMNLIGPYFDQQNSKNHILRGIFIFLVLLLILILLGLVKGLLGWCGMRKVGMFGLDKLIDLPRPLDYYQEYDLVFRPVEYDVAGWPIHPDTKERTVRVITKRTELCTNVIFFLSYPFIAIINCCAACYPTYDDDRNDDNTTFQSVNKIVVGTNDASMPDTYNDEDNAEEEEDTKYVLNEMQKSEEQLRVHQEDV